MAAVVTAATRLVEDLADDLHTASDELFDAIYAFARLAGADAIDELINCAFDPTEYPPRRPGVDPALLQAARERLRATGAQWAKAVVAIDVDDAGAEDRIDRQRLGAAFDRIGHRGSATFRRRVADAYDAAGEFAARNDRGNLELVSVA